MSDVHTPSQRRAFACLVGFSSVLVQRPHVESRVHRSHRTDEPDKRLLRRFVVDASIETDEGDRVETGVFDLLLSPLRNLEQVRILDVVGPRGP